MSHPDGLPDLFVDRSLGRIKVPTLLRDAGLRLTTLAERYGVPADEKISDERWLRDAGERREAVLMKDERIRYNPAEKAAVVEFEVIGFCLARRDLDSEAMADLFLLNLDRMVTACADNPFGLFVISHRGLRKVDI